MTQQAIQEAIQDSVRFLSSQSALDSIQADPYWPKWNSPWWHMLALYEMGLASQIPKSAARTLANASARQYSPDGKGPMHSPCPCGIGNIFQVLSAAGVDMDQELPWFRSWAMSLQMSDGGLNCDDDAYHAHPQASSIVGTIALLEAVLLFTSRPFTPEEERFLDRGAQCLLDRQLLRGSTAPHNAEERLDEEDWQKLCLPRFYFYDVLRGLSFILRWSEIREKPIARTMIDDAVRLLREKARGGSLRTERHSFEGVGTRLRSSSGEWPRVPKASHFPLLDEISAIGIESPWLTRSWEEAQARLDRLAKKGLLQ